MHVSDAILHWGQLKMGVAVLLPQLCYLLKSFTPSERRQELSFSLLIICFTGFTTTAYLAQFCSFFCL